MAQSVKNLPAMQKTRGSFPGLGRSPGEGNGNPFQYSYLGNPMDRGAWRAIVHEVARVRHDLATKPPPPHSKDTILNPPCTLLKYSNVFMFQIFHM